MNEPDFRRYATSAVTASRLPELAMGKTSKEPTATPLTSAKTGAQARPEDYYKAKAAGPKGAYPAKELGFTAVHCALFGATLLSSVSHATIIFCAKAFNGAITMSFTPEFACTEEPPGTVDGLLKQLVYSLCLTLVVLRHWVALSWFVKGLPWVGFHKTFGGELLGWSYKSLSQIAIAIIAAQLGYVVVEEEEERRKLEGAEEAEGVAGEAEEEVEAPEDNAWRSIGAYLFYALGLTLAVLLLFVCAKKLVSTVFHKCVTAIKPKMGSTTAGSKYERKAVAPSREEAEDWAQEFMTEAVGLSYGVAVNGAIVGAIAAVFPGMYLLIELYAILVFLGAAAFMTLPEPPEALGPLLDFYKDWYGTLAGLALASFGGEEYGLGKSLLEGSGASGMSEALLSASISSAVAVFFLWRATAVRLSHNLFGCIHVSAEAAEAIAGMMQAAAALALAWAWEDFAGLQACSYVEEDATTGAKVQTMWTYVFFVFLVMVPLGKYAHKTAEPWLAEAEDKIKAHHQLHAAEALF
jgi:hypothetical protein